MKTILIVTDNLLTAINGVSTTYKNIEKCISIFGYNIIFLEPSSFVRFSVPNYPEVKLSVPWNIGKKILNIKPDAIHIATEGPLGIATKIWCDLKGLKYTTAYHTNWPDYLNELIHLPIGVGYFIMRWFHKFSTKVLVTTESMKQRLLHHGFERLEIWSRGVDTKIFNPTSIIGRMNTPRPILLCVSRASKEKGLDDFCSLETNGTKILVGDGPYLDKLKSKYKDVKFVGYKHGALLAHFYANADVFVFPSKTDTFGVVILEANACGTPVAAYPVNGPIDIIEQGVNGYIADDLNVAITNALKCDRKLVSNHAQKYSWRACTETFVKNLKIIEYS